VEGCAHLTHLLVVMVQAAIHGYWTQKMSKPRPVPGSLDEVQDLDYLVNSCRLWREEGPIIEGFRKIIEQNRRGEVGR
jgi:hypothetical protein